MTLDDEPVAWQCEFDDETRWVEHKVLANQFKAMGWKITPLYTRPANDELRKAAGDALRLLTILVETGAVSILVAGDSMQALRAELEKP